MNISPWFENDSFTEKKLKKSLFPYNIHRTMWVEESEEWMYFNTFTHTDTGIKPFNILLLGKSTTHCSTM